MIQILTNSVTAPSRSARPPHQDLSLSGGRRVAAIALIAAFGSVVRNFQPQSLLQVPGIDAHEVGIAVARIRKSGEELERFEGDNRPPDHPRPGAELGAASENDRPTLHLQADEVPYRPFHDDRPAPH